MAAPASAVSWWRGLRLPALARLGFLAALACLIGTCSSQPGAARAEPTGRNGSLQLYVLYSGSCVQCRLTKPLVSRFADDHPGQLSWAMVLLEENQGRQLRQRYGARCVPAVLIVDETGRLLAGPRCGPVTYAELEELLQDAKRASGGGG